MKVCIHIQPASRSLGGAEVLAVNIALLLQSAHDVEIVHHRPWLDSAQLSAFCGAAFTRITTRSIERLPDYFRSRSSNPFKIWRNPRNWGRALAGECDLFLTVTHQLPAFNPAPHGVLLLLFPMSTPLAEWPLAKAAGESMRGWLSRRLYEWQYASLWRRYPVKLAISEFTARWARARWGIDCQVLWPLVDCSVVERPKSNVVMTLGRFSTSGVSKHQREMAEAFASAPELSGYCLRCIGEARTDDERRYVTEVTNGRERVSAQVNASRDEVRDSLAESRIFWHAAGLTEHEGERPEQMEHFGMATVEAMANGCVPVVIGRGGQTEIIQHGVNGYLCQSLEEMVGLSALLLRDSGLMAQMAAAARRRAADFGREAFARRLYELVPALRAE